MNPEEQLIWAQDAEHLRSNRVWKAVWERMESFLESRALRCDTNRDPGVAQDILRCKQLVKALQREVDTLIEDGEVAKVQLKELEQSRRRGVFRR